MKYALAFILSMSCFAVHAQHTHHPDVPPTNEFVVTGAVKKETVFHINDLEKYKPVKLGDVIIKSHNGNAVDTIKGLSGILLKDLLDNVAIASENPKEYSEYYITLVASDGYKSVYSWNELFNTEVGNHVYIITELEGKTIARMPQRILVMSLSDFNNGRRHLIGLSKIVYKRAD